jgi:epoxyqueuosine reductase QueG
MDSGMKEAGVALNAIYALGKALGADRVGLAPVSAWNGEIEMPPELLPAAIWPKARSVVVMAVRVQEGAGEAEVRLLDEAAYRVALWLTQRGCPSVHIPCDAGEANYIPNAFDARQNKTGMPLFSHERAGELAGLGVVDRQAGNLRFMESRLVESRSDPRELRAVSVLTTFEGKE